MEASYHANTAGINASTSARAEGDDKTVNAALLGTTAPCGEACGWTMLPMTIGTLIVLDSVLVKFKDWIAKNKREADEENKYLLGSIENMAYADPCRLQSLIQEDFELVVEEARRLCYVSITERHKLIQHQINSVALLRSLDGDDEAEETTSPHTESSTPGK